jgi:hypothetical protein
MGCNVDIDKDCANKMEQDFIEAVIPDRAHQILGGKFEWRPF